MAQALVVLSLLGVPPPFPLCIPVATGIFNPGHTIFSLVPDPVMQVSGVPSMPTLPFFQVSKVHAGPQEASCLERPGLGLAPLEGSSMASPFPPYHTLLPQGRESYLVYAKPYAQPSVLCQLRTAPSNATCG